MQYGSLRCTAELRANKFGINKVVVPIGVGFEGNRIWMHLKQPKRNPLEVFLKPDQNLENTNNLNFRNSKYFNQLKKTMEVDLKNQLIKNMKYRWKSSK